MSDRKIKLKINIDVCGYTIDYFKSIQFRMCDIKQYHYILYFEHIAAF